MKQLSQQKPSTLLQQTEPPRQRIIDPDLTPLSDYEATFEQSPRRQKSEPTRSPIAGLTTSPESLPQEILSTETGRVFVRSDCIACPDNIINDESRLEILIGGKRARNNSPKIINEAAGICQRLFQNIIMDAHIYRELIDSD